MNKQVRVNVRCNIGGKSRREKLNGRDVIIVPAATLPDGIVMNEIQYPADEIEASYASLERTPAPLGHPTINGEFVSARDPEGINIGWIGSWNANVRRENGRVFMDKIIDVERANQSEGGKSVLAAIEKGDPIHSSTGLLCMLEAASGDVDYKHIARSIVFDHDAWLIGEDGAGTPEQGVGVFVNAAGKSDKITVINSSLVDDADEEVNWALQSLAQALDKRDRAPFLERMKATIREALGLERGTSTNEKEMDMDKEQFDALSAKVNGLAEANDKMGETIANAVTVALKPVLDAQAELAANAKAKDDAELAELRAVIVKANLLDEEGAAELTLNVARKMAPKAKPGTAAAINGVLATGETKGEFDDYDLNAGMETVQ